MTLPRYYAIQDEWSNAPPLRRMAAAWFKFKPKRRGGSEKPGTFEDLIRTFAPNGKTVVIG